MTRKRTIHEVAFRLSYDIGAQIAPKIEGGNVKLAPQQLRAMREIWRRDGCTLADIGKTLKRDKGQVSRIVDELSNAGMVLRKPNPDDGRSKILKISAKGRKFFEMVESIEAEFSRQLTKGISAADLKTFFLVSDHLSENLRDLENS